MILLKMDVASFKDGCRLYLALPKAEPLYSVVFGPSGIGPFSLLVSSFLFFSDGKGGIVPTTFRMTRLTD